MIVELVRIQTGDGVRLDGVVSHAQEGSTPGVVVCLHGVGSNFYGSSMMNRLAIGLTDSQWDVLRVNTRGHDHCYVGAYRMGTRRFGAGYEIVSDCVHDLAAWIDWAEQAEYKKIVILGHSLGALKAVYRQTHVACDRVTALLAISPPRLSCRIFQSGFRAGEFKASLDAAEKLVESGNPDALVDVTFPFPLLITAGSYVDKYGPAEKYDLVGFVPRLNLPTHFIYGGSELEQGGVAFEGLDQLLVDCVKDTESAQLMTLEVIAGADHLYTRHADDLLSSVKKMLMQW